MTDSINRLYDAVTNAGLSPAFADLLVESRLIARVLACKTAALERGGLSCSFRCHGTGRALRQIRATVAPEERKEYLFRSVPW